ncbi:metallophosphoesterase family protein [Paenibacillus albidus]|nr:metallophosphoesterase family protein [Paenibacillus albidus]
MTDIHGEYQGMELLLKHAEVDFEADQLVFGGDMIDRGEHSGSVIKRIKELADTYPNVQAVIGNHEEMLRDYYRSGDKLWLSHGGRATLKDFEKTFSKAEMDEHIEWIIRLPLVYADEEYVYTHAGLNPHEPLDQQSRDILWMSEYDFYNTPLTKLLGLTHNKPVIYGHTPVERIYFDGARLNCDMGSHTYPIERGLGLVNLTEMIYWVYKPSSKKIEQRKVTRI